ncbi:MAG: hypothetical protein ACOZF0_00290 [Thermodesulfobacteriota bacterium]
MIYHIDAIIGKFDYLDNRALGEPGPGHPGKQTLALGRIRKRINGLGGSANNYILKKMGLQLSDMLDML